MSINSPAPRIMPDQSVAQLTPALYAGAVAANLNGPQVNQLNQIAGTVSLNKQLLSMSKNDAATKWRTLDPHVQEQIKSMYGDATYIPQAPKNIFVKAIGTVAGTALGPFKAAFNVAKNYGQAINTPYLAMREISQGANPFDWHVWQKAYDGTMVYDQGSLQALHQQHGDTDTFVAMKTLQGLKPGQIIDAYGRVDANIINSIQKMVDNPDQFRSMLNQFKGAQVSVGRDIARVMFNAQPTDNKLYSSGAWNKTSGVLDAITQIVIDPLTWATGGTAGAATKGAKLAEALASGTKTIDQVFARRDVMRTWNDVAGPIVRRYSEAIAAKDYTAAAAARTELGRQVPDLNSDGMLKLLSSNKVYDVESAKNLFSKSAPMTELLAGNVDGTSFFRNGIPIAKRSRMISSGLNKVMGDYFTGALEKSVLDKVGPNFVKDLEKVGIENDPVYAGTTDLLKNITGELSGVRRRLGRMAARHPGNTAINITDEGVDGTLNVVRDMARTIYPKSHSEYFAQAFKDSTEADRVILLRGLYTQIMHNLGLHASDGGKDLMEQILRDKFGDSVNFTTRKELDIAPQHAPAIKARGVLESQAPEREGGLMQTSVEGPVHPYQGKPVIGNLPWHGAPGEASLADYAFNFNKNAQVREIVKSAGGVTRNQFVRQLVDSWSAATLFPRLGIRSAIDEAFFFVMGQPGRDLVRYAQGRKIAKGIAAFTGGDELIPPIKRMLLDKLGTNPTKYVPSKSVYEDGTLIRQGRTIKTDLNGEEVWRLAKREDIANEAMRMIESAVPQHLHDYMYQAMVHHPEISNAMVNSIIGKSGLSEGLAGGDLASMIVSNSNLSQMFKALKIAPSGKYKEWSMEELAKINEALPAAAHYQNFFMKFTKNTANFGKGSKDFFDPASVFMRNNGLRTEQDFTRARDTLLTKIGINPELGTITDADALGKYLNFSQQRIREKELGFTEVESATKRIEASLHDLYFTFHGGALNFNDKLYNFIKDLAGTIESETKVHANKAMREALNSVDFPKFQELTHGFRPDGMINADVNLAKEATNEGVQQAIDRWNTNLQHKGMEWMDAQNNHMFRQPALWLTYAKLRERYANLEQNFIKEQMANGLNKELATQIAEKKFTETAMNHASNHVLTYVDNPRVKSNLAYTLRTTGRFYRATEDFYRRVFRLKEVTPQVIYRLRLGSLGLQSNGFLHPDANGDPYLVVPADNVLFHAMNMFTSPFGSDNVVKQPMYNDFALRLSMGNPSFQQDAGQPSLSGPLMALPVLGIKAALGQFGGGWGKQAASDIDRLVLGNVSQNLTPMKAFVPSALQRAWDMLPKGEWDQQTVSAAMQAVAYNAANGNILPTETVRGIKQEDYIAKRKQYLDDIKITAHNVLFLRSFLGLMSPIAPTMMEDKGVPDYLKNTGINGLRAEFADILQAVMRNSKGNIADPYEAALLAFTGKHPGKLVYTVARDSSSNIMVNKTKETQSWMQANATKINDYGDAALIFAPNMGNYDANAFTWMQAAGLVKQKKLSDYFDQVQVEQDKQAYFNLSGLQTQAMRDPSLDAEQRQSYINQVSALKEQLKIRNPYLEPALNQSGYGIGKQENMLTSLKGILKDEKFPMSPQVRAKMGTATAIVSNALDALQAIGLDQDVADGGLQKQNIKEAAIQAVRELGGAQGNKAPQDTQIQEALRSIFIPILDNKARTTVKAVGR